MAPRALLRDVERALERDRERLELGRRSELGDRLDARPQVADRRSVPGAQAGVDDVCVVPILEHRPNATAEEIVERRVYLGGGLEIGITGVS